MRELTAVLLLLPVTGLALGFGLSGVVNYCDPFTRHYSGLARLLERSKPRGKRDR